MGRKDFGVFVKSLRKREGWSRVDLSERTGPQGLSKAVIGDIEQGSKEYLRVESDVEPLARAFELSDGEKVIFYAKAGFVYEPTWERPNQELIRQLMLQVEYPASIRTRIWDLVAFNEYHRVLHSYSDDEIEKLGDKSILGPNLLRALFHREFKNHQSSKKEHDWQRKTILSFRDDAFPFINTQRYSQILQEMLKIRDFRDEWHRATGNSLPIHSPFRRPVFEIEHPEFGSLKFLSLRFPQGYVSVAEKVIVYVPLSDSEEKYRELRGNIDKDHVYTFPLRTLE